MADEKPRKARRDRPWIFRTYAGHSTAADSNKLYRTNLAKGQTGLSVAFDLPTQTGFDSDHELARGEVGKVGVPISHIGDLRTLFENIPLDQMNTSMTINATAAWLLALYTALAEEQGVARACLTGTTQNDIVKEYLSRGTYVFPPGPSMRLIKDTITWSYRELPKWNPMNVCSYHLQEAGATPVQEIAYALATATAVLDAVRSSREVPPDEFPFVVGRISFFVNAGIKFITEICKMRAFSELWDEICLERYGVEDEKLRRFRYGVQVNSLGLTEQQPENNVHRILLEMLAVTLSKNARARAVQLPAWNEALGLPRPWDQQWSLRMQQILAHETDLLAYGDIFDGSQEIADKVEHLKSEARRELAHIETLGGAIAAVDTGYMKKQLVASNTTRIAAIENGDETIIGLNAYTETEPSPLSKGETNSFVTVADSIEYDQIERLKQWRKDRNNAAAETALSELSAAAREDRNIMEASVVCAKTGVTTGEWGAALREVFGEYRAPTGVDVVIHVRTESVSDVKQAVAALSAKLGTPVRFLVGKPGLDGHSNGAEQIAVRAAGCGMDVRYDGIRLTPAEIVAAAIEDEVHAIGLSILSGSHVPLVRDVMNRLRSANLGHLPVIVGGIIPEEDRHVLKQLGVAAVYTPSDYRINGMMSDIVKLIDNRNSNAAA